MALASSGSSAALSASASWSGWRNAAFSSSVTLPSRAFTWPSADRIIGLTSTSVASSSTKQHQSFSMSSAAPSSDFSGRPPAAAISRAFARSTPVSAETGTLATFSGEVWATSSMSMPPAAEQMARKVRFARSSRKEK